MGRSVESFRMALEGEICRWNGFSRALRLPERAAFEELMDACRGFASESSCANNPILFEPMVMSILLAQQLRIQKLEEQLQTRIWQDICNRQTNGPKPQVSTVET